MKRFVVPILLSACALVSLSACGAAADGVGTSDSGDPNGFYVYHVHEDGRTVTCLFQDDNGSISCDWEHAK